jgi:nucleoside-diphosphate-sugar epimerase
MKTALVTGCSGLVGTFLVQKMLTSKKFTNVIGVDLKDFPINMNDEPKKKFKFLKLDLTI